MSHLLQLAYTSIATRPFTTPELVTLLARARRKNKELEVTGMLLHVEGSFFQVLEGEADTVLSLYQRITFDPRHIGVSTVISEPISERAFPEWSMGFTRLSREEILGIPGLRDMDAENFSLSRIEDRNIGSGRAKMLLRGFTEGRWRARLIGDTWLPTT